MEPKIVQRYNDNILHEAMKRFGIEKDNFELLDGFESFIYEYSNQHGEYILRVSHSLRRTPELIAGEVDWINYLAEGGASVSRAIYSQSGNLVEVVADGHGDQFLATAFKKAPGRPTQKEDWTPEFFEHYGRVIGRIHSLTKDYLPTDLSWRRPEWDDPKNLELEDWLPASEAAALTKFRELMPYFETLPKNRDGYGLIHQDAHGDNIFVDNGQITLFDFDDCVYGWFIYDIAMVLFYAAMWKEDKAAFTDEFMGNFLRGYSNENKLDALWLKELPYFLKLREIDLYAVIHRSMDVDNLDDPWCVGYMRGRKDKIESDAPYIDFDWSSLSKYL
ncbi:MAG: phosphotransferase [Anaerolineales bacterium]|nr:phosphotransferase [Chloroflexota bacterium]MBL6983577.1 phosphotransferase [Anaerolineales bacterium]